MGGNWEDKGIRIATLNVKGRSNEGKSKWPALATMIRKQRIMILGVQETHLNDEENKKLERACPKLQIINNSNHKNKEGVAFVFNKELTNGMKWKHEVIIKNRVSWPTIQIEGENGMCQGTLYAP